MKNKTKWFDPICYQFSFYLLGKKDEAWNPVEATKPFFEELIPYYNLWIALQGTVNAYLYFYMFMFIYTCSYDADYMFMLSIYCFFPVVLV